MGVSIIGAGKVGQALAKVLSEKSVPVTIGVPNAEQYLQQGELRPNIEIDNIPAAIAKNDLIVFALPYETALELAKGIPNWQDKIIIDATNPLLPSLDGLSVGTNTSGAEEIAKLANQARVVKAFNAIDPDHLANPSFEDGRPLVPIAGTDLDARQKVTALAEKIGLDAMDAGELSAARYIEPLAMLWVHNAVHTEQEQSVFSRLRR